MARVTRYTQSIFGSTAGADEIAQYGSFAAGAPQTYSGSTITPAIVQSLGNYLSGWVSAVEGAYSPALQDMNALCYLFAYQLTYLLQAGIAEWDSGTTYYTGDIVQSSGTWYVSLTNTNLNNAVTDSTNWFAPTQAGIQTENTLPYTAGMTLSSGNTLSWPMLTVGNGQTVTVPNGARLSSEGAIIVSGTGVVVATGTGVVRVF